MVFRSHVVGRITRYRPYVPGTPYHQEPPSHISQFSTLCRIHNLWPHNLRGRLTAAKVMQPKNRGIREQGPVCPEDGEGLDRVRKFAGYTQAFEF